MMHATVSKSLRRCTELSVSALSVTDVHRADLLPTFLQAGLDVHGSHGLFYWLRARGRGVLVAGNDAAMVLAWRPDVGRLVAVRPVGEPDAVAAMLDLMAAALPASAELVARYCSAEVAARLRDLGWTGLRRPWHPYAPADDETFPEVIVTAPAVEMPGGPRYKPLREALYRHRGHYTYRATSSPLGIGEDRFIRRDAARAGRCDPSEAAFNEAVLHSLGAGRHDWLSYHYLIDGGRLAGFAINANLTGISHGYYLSTLDVPRLSTFFLWHIYLHQRRSGAFALNLGGSETATLFGFKTHTFPDHVLQHTTALQSPTSRRRGRSE